jgi:tetratricopeptide (TPR) repeat protein
LVRDKRTRWVLGAILSVLVASCGGPKAPPAGGANSSAAPLNGGRLGALRAAIEEGRRDDSDGLLDKLSDQEKASRAGRVLAGRVAELHGAGTDAKDAYNGVLREEPGHIEASLALGARLLDEGDTKGALDATDRGLDAHPNDASLLLNRAYIVLTTDGFPAAGNAFFAAERASGGSGIVRLSYASALTKAGRGREAVDVLARVAADAHSTVGELAEAGHELRQQGAFAPCLAAFDRVVAERDGGEIRVERALCKLGLRDPEGSLKELDAGIQAEPTYAPLFFYRGGRLAEGHRWRDAKAAYEKYLLLAPDGSLADMAKKRLRMIMATLEK